MRNKERTNLADLLLEPPTVAKFLLATVSVVSSLFGMLQIWQQYRAALVVTYENRDVILPRKLVPLSPIVTGPWGFADFLPSQGPSNPKTNLTIIGIENRKDIPVDSIQIKLNYVSRLLFVSGGIIYPEVEDVSSQLKVDHSTNTLTLNISGLPELKPGSEASIYVFGDALGFGFTPLTVLSKEGAGTVTTVSNVSGVARIFAYSMVWLVSIISILFIWALIKWIWQKFG